MGRSFKRAFALTLLLGLAAAVVPARAQGLAGGRAGTGQTGSAQPLEPAPSGWARWVGVDTAAAGARYRFLEDPHGITTASQVQLRQVIRGRFRFDARDLVAIRVGALSGSSFVSSWNSTGIGTGKRTWALHVRHLLVAVRPVRGVEILAGSLELARGNMTEAIGYDADGHVSGERVTIARPDVLPVDEIVVTSGYLGDFRQPDFFRRAHRLGEWNYAQMLARWRLGPSASLTGELAHARGAETVRVALSVRTPALRVVDSLIAEVYGRTDPSDAGVHLGAQRRIAGKISVRAGVADIDPVTGAWNSDRLAHGRRAYVSLSATVLPHLTLQVWAGRAFGRTAGLPILTRVDAALEYDILGALRGGEAPAR